eukprot:gene1575-32960_t
MVHDLPKLYPKRYHEDLCLLSPSASGDAYRLLGGVVCFPAHWSVLEKLNKDLPDIHDPVPRWRTDAATVAHKFFTHLTTDKPKIRWNWTLSATAELHLSKFHSRPLQEEADELDPAGVDKLQLRLERQHFIRLPRSQAIIFNIRTYMQVVSEAVRGRPRLESALAGALRDLPCEHLVYKSNLQLRMPQLLELLDSEANGVTVH